MGNDSPIWTPESLSETDISEWFYVVVMGLHISFIAVFGFIITYLIGQFTFFPAEVPTTLSFALGLWAFLYIMIVFILIGVFFKPIYILSWLIVGMIHKPVRDQYLELSRID